MRVSELIKLLEPFTREGEDPIVLVAVNPDQSLGGVMPVAPDTVKLWSINDQDYAMIFKEPN